MNSGWRNSSDAFRTIDAFLLFRCFCEQLLARAHIAEQPAGNFPHLDFLAAFGDAIAAMMAIDMFERFVARIADAAMDLHRAVGSFAAQAVCPVIAHRNLVGELLFDL